MKAIATIFPVHKDFCSPSRWLQFKTSSLECSGHGVNGHDLIWRSVRECNNFESVGDQLYKQVHLDTKQIHAFYDVTKLCTQIQTTPTSICDPTRTAVILTWRTVVVRNLKLQSQQRDKSNSWSFGRRCWSLANFELYPHVSKYEARICINNWALSSTNLSLVRDTTSEYGRLEHWPSSSKNLIPQTSNHPSILASNLAKIKLKAKASEEKLRIREASVKNTYKIESSYVVFSHQKMFQFFQPEWP